MHTLILPTPSHSFWGSIFILDPPKTYQSINLRQEVWLGIGVFTNDQDTQIQMERTIDFGSHVRVWKIKLSDIQNNNVCVCVCKGFAFKNYDSAEIHV